jgi:hypothetical protein
MGIVLKDGYFVVGIKVLGSGALLVAELYGADAFASFLQ